MSVIQNVKMQYKCNKKFLSHLYLISEMGKVKYQKRVQSAAGSKTERKTSAFNASTSSKNKKEKKTVPLSARHFQRRLAITPEDINDDERLAKAYKNFIQNHLPVDKGHDGLHVAKQNKRAKKRMLARKKLAGAFGNMGSLVDALPTLKEDNKNSSEPVNEKPRLSRSLKLQELEMMKDIQWYNQAIQDPSFQADPFAAITANIHLRLQNEQKESS